MSINAKRGAWHGSAFKRGINPRVFFAPAMRCQALELGVPGTKALPEPFRIVIEKLMTWSHPLFWFLRKRKEIC